MVTNLKEATANVDVLGVLAEKNLEFSKSRDGGDIITGDMVIQTSDINFVKFRVYTNKLTKSGDENSIYKGLCTVIDEYKSIAEVGKEEATIVSVSGNSAKVQPNSYIDRNGDIVSNVQFSANFFNRPKGEVNPEDFHATFDIEMFVESMRPEVYTSGEKSGELTGSIIVKGYVPMYGGTAEPIEVVVPPVDGLAEDVDNAVEIGETRLFMGDINNNRVEVVKTAPVAIGKARTKKTVTYKNELTVTGVSEAYEGAMAFDQDAIKAALAVRDEKLQKRAADKKKESANASSAVNSKPASSGRSLAW